MKRATRNAVTRAWGLCTVGVGMAFLVRPHALAGLVTGGRHTPDDTVVRVLGGRQLLQGALITRTPTPLLIVGGTVTDALHATSMLAVAAFWPRYRKAALTSAAIAGVSGIVGATIALDDRRNEHRNVTDRDIPARDERGIPMTERSVTSRARAAEFPPHVLREYALLADGERGAVVGPGGDIAWMCAPVWDSPAVFSALLGGTGGYAITPAGRFVWGGFYEQRTLIWRSRWVTDSGIMECREALAFPADPHRVVLLRRIIATSGDADVHVVFNPRGGFGTEDFTDLHHHGPTWTGRTDDLQVRWSGAPEHTRESSGVLRADFTVPAGSHHDLVLEISDRTLPDAVPDPDNEWLATETAWHEAVPELANCLEPRDARHSYAVLRGLTSAGGGMVAAATTSLPERAEAGRNYDYRYVWIRDQCYAGMAVAAAGDHPLLDDAVAFVAGRLLEHGPDLKPAYTTTGARVPDQHRLDLPGYPGGANLIGNWVNQQFQLDAFGEALLLLSAAGRRDRLDVDARSAITVAADAIKARWTQPDDGIWEIDNRPWTHSRLICVAGLRAAAALEPTGPVAVEWLRLADTIMADTSAHCLHPTGRWQRSPADPGLDGALLLPPLRGALPADDPRTISTLDAYLRELTRDGYAYRFRHDDRPLAQAEGAFTLCGFLVALALHQQGRQVEAARWYERTNACAGPPQLYSEEFDVGQHQLRGNLPQAFVHALHLQAGAQLAW